MISLNPLYRLSIAQFFVTTEPLKSLPLYLALFPSPRPNHQAIFSVYLDIHDSDIKVGDLIAQCVANTPSDSGIRPCILYTLLYCSCRSLCLWLKCTLHVIFHVQESGKNPQSAATSSRRTIHSKLQLVDLAGTMRSLHRLENLKRIAQSCVPPNFWFKYNLFLYICIIILIPLPPTAAIYIIRIPLLLHYQGPRGRSRQALPELVWRKAWALTRWEVEHNNWTSRPPTPWFPLLLSMRIRCTVAPHALSCPPPS